VGPLKTFSPSPICWILPLVTHSTLSATYFTHHWWFTLNGFSLNPDKSEAIILGTGTRPLSAGSLDVIDLSDVNIQPSESVRSLGVVTDSTLCFNAHINSIFNAANYHAKALYIISEELLRTSS